MVNKARTKTQGDRTEGVWCISEVTMDFQCVICVN